jgi:hypothetical protein
MPQELVAILPHIITVAAIVSGAVSWLFKVIVEKRLDAAAQKAVAEFKHTLDGEAARAAFDYQRRLQNYNLFISKKHEVIANLHALVHDARIKAWVTMCYKENGPSEDEGRSMEEARDSFNDLGHYFQRNELYLPGSMADLVHSGMIAISEVIQPTDPTATDIGERSLEYRKLFWRITELMRAELGRGDMAPTPSVLPAVDPRTKRPAPLSSLSDCPDD